MGSHVVNVRERANTGGGVGGWERKSKRASEQAKEPGGGEKWREGGDSRWRRKRVIAHSEHCQPPVFFLLSSHY